MLQYLRQYPVDEYSSQYFPGPDTHQFAKMLASQNLTVEVGSERRKATHG